MPHGEKDATTDLALIEQWWTTEPNANTAVATGPSNLLVVDGDGDNGQTEFLNWCAGFGLELPVTPIARTGGDGVHVFFGRKGLEIKSSVRFIESCDTRGKSGYVLLTPSNHRSGRRYEWSTQVGLPIADIPDLLATKLLAAKGHPKASGDGGTRPSYNYKEAVKYGAKGGYRDAFFSAHAFRMKRLGFTPQAAIDDMKRVWELSEQPPGEEYDLLWALEKVKRVYEDESIKPEIMHWPAGGVVSV